jgi:hypothetical protein
MVVFDTPTIFFAHWLFNLPYPIHWLFINIQIIRVDMRIRKMLILFERGTLYNS